MIMSLEEKYPFIASWVRDSQIQIGRAESWYEYDPIAAVVGGGLYSKPMSRSPVAEYFICGVGKRSQLLNTSLTHTSGNLVAHKNYVCVKVLAIPAHKVFANASCGERL
jgi:hypothetical protein